MNETEFEDSAPWWPALSMSTSPTSSAMRSSKPLGVSQSDSVLMRSEARKAVCPLAVTFTPHPMRFASVVPCVL